MKPNLINVDFEFISLHEFSLIVSELKDKIEVLVNEKIDGKYHLNFECSIPDTEVTPNAIINIFFELIESLSDESKKYIYNCENKIIDIGYNSGSEGWQYNVLPNEVLRKMADKGFQLNISIYGIEPCSTA